MDMNTANWNLFSKIKPTYHPAARYMVLFADKIKGVPGGDPVVFNEAGEPIGWTPDETQWDVCMGYAYYDGTHFHLSQNGELLNNVGRWTECNPSLCR